MSGELLGQPQYARKQATFLENDANVPRGQGVECFMDAFSGLSFVFVNAES